MYCYLSTSTIFSLQFTKNCLAVTLRPDPRGSLSASAGPLDAKRDLLLRGGVGKGIGWEGREGRERDGRGNEGRGRDGRRKGRGTEGDPPP